MLILYLVYHRRANHSLHQQCTESQMYLKRNLKWRKKDLQQILFYYQRKTKFFSTLLKQHLRYKIKLTKVSEKIHLHPTCSKTNP